MVPMNQFPAAAEEKAMQMLGYRKAWTGCGEGGFLWMKLSSKPS
jgi:hypothetical protein